MLNCLRVIIILILFIFKSAQSAGSRESFLPLLINDQLSIPNGWIIASLTASQTNGYGEYSNYHLYIPSPMYFTNDMNLTINYGLSDTLDFLFTFDYLQNKSSLVSFNDIGDTTLTLGYNIVGPTNPTTDLRLELSLLVPTGRYTDLKPKLYTTDATGGGSYQPSLGFSFNHKFQLNPEHALSLYSNSSVTYAYRVTLSGINAYGGSPSTFGRIRPGNSINFLIGAKYSLTDKWSAAFDYSVYAAQPSSFRGLIAIDLEEYLEKKLAEIRVAPPGQAYISPRIIFNSVLPTIRNIGGQDFLGSGSVTMFTLNPTLSYDFAENYNLLFSMSVTAPGSKNTPAVYTPSVTLTRTIS